jgi:D-alanyl-D-alanine carboxypeptidase-like protein
VPSPQPTLRRLVPFLLLAFVAVAAFLGWRGDRTDFERTPAGGAGPGAQVPQAVQPAALPAYLAWISGGFDEPHFREKAEQLDRLTEAVVVAGDTLWLGMTEDADGRMVQDPPEPYAFPIDAFAVQPSDYAPFVGPSVRTEIVRALQQGKAVLGSRSAKLRKLGVGGVLRFRTGTVRVGAVVPDDAVGWSEVMVSRDVGRRLGIEHERYLLGLTDDPLTEAGWKRMLRPLIGDESLRVDLPGKTPYVRVASGVRPAIVIKRIFGEFAAAPQPGSAYFTIQRSWIDRNIVTTDVPLLGSITCHRKLIPMVRGAIEEVMASGLSSEIKVYSGCWASRTVARSLTAPPSYHAYGAAIDINAPQNPYGTTPTQDPRIVRIFEHWGFNWGGDFLIPDGHHFEFWAVPEELRAAA